MVQTPPSLLQRLHNQPDDAAAWERFDSIYRPLLTTWLRRHSLQDHDLEDLLQDVLQTVVSEMPRFEYDPRKGHFRAWLRSILVNRLREFWRERKGRPQFFGETYAQLLEQFEDPGSDLARLWDQQHDQEVIQRTLELIRPDFNPITWTAFQRLMAGERPAAVAAALGLTRNAVYLARSGILKRLREEIGGLVD